MSVDPKEAATLAGVHQLIRQRWSPRSFSEKPVSTEDLTTILEAARWAASSYNEQPWRFIVAAKSDRPAFEKMLAILVPFNQSWARSASVLILMAARKTFTRNNDPNLYALHDAGAALANLSLQATALGLHVHSMAGFDHDKARTDLGIPEEFQVAAFSALGYLGTAEELPEELKKQELAPRSRKPLSELAFTTKWGNPTPLS